MTDAHTVTRNLGGVWRNGRGQAPCPICQQEGRQNQHALSICEQNGKILLHCFKSGCSFVDIASAASVPLTSAQVDFDAASQNEARQAEYQAKQLAKARSIWDLGKPISGTKAEAYLRSRGITAELPQALRFVPDIFHGPTTSWCSAMVANVEPTGGVHRTFFTKKGERLSKSAKMMLGPCSGGAVRLSGTGGPLVVCEGIETGLSLLSGLLSGPHTVWAALSTSGIKGLTLPPEPGELIIAPDGDNAGHEAADKLAFRANALGWTVSLMAAPEGQDWNDVLREGVAA